METNKLQWQDYVVIVITLAISVGIGIYYRFTGGRQKTSKEYFVANKSMSIFPVGVALVVSFMSAITLLGVSEENYNHGTQFVVINFAYLIGTPIVCYGFLPVFYNMGATSAYEYLEKRFGYWARLTASFICWLQLFLYSGVVLYAPALALEATTGLSRELSIVGVGLICAFYSSIGGIKAVLITDVFQGILMLASVIMIITTAAINIGGLSEIWRIAKENNRIEFTNMSPDFTVRHTVWGLIIGGLGTFLSLYGVNQVQVQRLLTVRNLKSSRIAMWLNWPFLMTLSLTTSFSGLAIYSYYYKCDPIKSGRIASPDMLMPLYVMDNLSHLPGLPGLFIAGVFSAGLSTISASLNSLAAVTLEDFMKPLHRRCGGEHTEKKTLLFGKILVFLFGIMCIILAFLAQYLGGVLQASLTIFGVVGGPLLGIFTLGMLFEFANQCGAVMGTIVSLICMLIIAFGPKSKILPLQSYQPQCNATNITTQPAGTDESLMYLFRISYIWYSTIGFCITVIVGVSVSLIYRKSNEELDPNLFFPYIANVIRKKRQTENNGNLRSNSMYVFKQSEQSFKKTEDSEM